MQPKNAKDRQYYFGLDLIRFCSACLVLLFHLGYSTWQPESGARYLVRGEYTIPEGSIFWFGWLGVQIFFVISGFVIANSAQGASPYKFFRSRALRLYPAAWICATISLVTLLAFTDRPALNLLWRYLHSVTLFPLSPWIEGVYWTLAAEIIFYGLIFLLISFKGLDRLETFSNVMGAISIGFIVLVACNRSGLAQIDHLEGFRKTIGKYFPLWYGVFFSLGINLWLSARRRLSRVSVLYTAMLFVACCSQIYVGLSHADVEEGLSGKYQDWRVPVAIFAIAVAGLLASTHWPAVDKSIPHIAREPLRRLGLVTYPLYLVHFSLGVILIKAFIAAGASPVMAFAMSGALLFLLCLYIATKLEPALRRRSGELLDRLEQRFGLALPFHRRSEPE